MHTISKTIWCCATIVEPDNDNPVETTAGDLRLWHSECQLMVFQTNLPFHTYNELALSHFVSLNVNHNLDGTLK